MPLAATFSTTDGSPGSLRLADGRLVAAGATAAGSFELTVDGRALRGTWTSATDFALDLAGRSGVEAGLLVGTLEGGGRFCLRVRNAYASAADVHGSFTLAGADGSVAGLLASATYTGRVGVDGTLVLDGGGRAARTAAPAVGCERDLHTALATVREQLAGLDPSAQLDRLLGHVDAALDPARWDGGRPVTVDVLLSLRRAVKHAPGEQRRALVEVGRNAAEARFGDALVAGETALANAQAHLDGAASHPGTPAALDDAIRAWTALGG